MQRSQVPDPPQVSRPTGDVVLGLDLAHPNGDLLEFAFVCADRYGSDLRVLHTWPLPPAFGPDLAGVLTEQLTDFENERSNALDTLLAPWTQKYPAVPVSQQVRQGRPAVDLAESSRDAGLMFVGRRSRSARLGAHIGAVTHAVVHHSLAPVASCRTTDCRIDGLPANAVEDEVVARARAVTDHASTHGS
ncbi:universal stress protein [Streptomyces sp. NPDC055287]